MLGEQKYPQLSGILTSLSRISQYENPGGPRCERSWNSSGTFPPAMPVLLQCFSSVRKVRFATCERKSPRGQKVTTKNSMVILRGPFLKHIDRNIRKVFVARQAKVAKRIGKMLYYTSFNGLLPIHSSKQTGQTPGKSIHWRSMDLILY